MSRPITIEHQGRAVRAGMVTAAPIQRAWQAWAEPERLSQWFTDRASGRARPGGLVTWRFDRFRSEFPYEVLVADEPHRLVLKGSPPGRPPYVLEILIGPDARGTLVEIVNSGFSVGPGSDEEYEGVVSGWQMALAILKEYLERHFGEPKTSFFAMQPAPLSYDGVLRHFLDGSGLSRWLTVDGSIPGAGESYRLVLKDGSPMSGRVLAVTSREVALSWDEIHGVIELKAFALGPRTRAVAARGCGWNLSEDAADRIERMLALAIDRLVAVLVAEAEAR